MLLHGVYYTIIVHAILHYVYDATEQPVACWPRKPAIVALMSVLVTMAYSPSQRSSRDLLLRPTLQVKAIDWLLDPRSTYDMLAYG